MSQFELAAWRFLCGPRLPGFAYAASIIPTQSSMDHNRSDKPAAMAGEVRSVLCWRTKSDQTAPVLAVVRLRALLYLALERASNVDGVADHVSGALLAFRSGRHWRPSTAQLTQRS